MSTNKSNAVNNTAQNPNSAIETKQGLDKHGPAREGPGDVSIIKTAEEAVRGLRTLSREALTLREGLTSLLSREESATPPAQRHLRFGRSALEHAAAVFELLADLLEND